MEHAHANGRGLVDVRSTTSSVGNEGQRGGRRWWWAAADLVWRRRGRPSLCWCARRMSLSEYCCWPCPRPPTAPGAPVAGTLPLPVRLRVRPDVRPREGCGIEDDGEGGVGASARVGNARPAGAPAHPDTTPTAQPVRSPLASASAASAAAAAASAAAAAAAAARAAAVHATSRRQRRRALLARLPIATAAGRLPAHSRLVHERVGRSVRLPPFGCAAARSDPPLAAASASGATARRRPLGGPGAAHASCDSAQAASGASKKDIVHCACARVSSCCAC
jgi:hypothetical protein